MYHIITNMNVLHSGTHSKPYDSHTDFLRKASRFVFQTNHELNDIRGIQDILFITCMHM